MDNINISTISEVVKDLAQNHVKFSRMCHMRYGKEPLPQQSLVEELVDTCRAILFPGFFGNEEINAQNIEYSLGIACDRLSVVLEDQISAGLTIASGDPCGEMPEIQARARDLTARFISDLPKLRDLLFTDVDAIFLGDPAAATHQEVIYCYPAVKAISAHRIAHQLYGYGIPIIPRMISEIAHSETGIDIHPGAQISHHFAIDHGTGVVIGETAIIGHHVKLYQGVTLGARSFPTDENGNPIKGIDRHPIIGNNVVIYSNATILGRITIGDNAVVGGNVWVTQDVPPGARVVQAKTR